MKGSTASFATFAMLALSRRPTLSFAPLRIQSKVGQTHFRLLEPKQHNRVRHLNMFGRIGESLFGISPENTIKEAMADPAVMILDVRTKEEVRDTPPRMNTINLEGDVLEAEAENYFPDKSATIICFCKKGGRAAAAKSILEKKGYENVLNGGGVDNVNRLA